MDEEIQIGQSTYRWDEASKSLTVARGDGQEQLAPDQTSELYAFLYDHQDGIREARYEQRYGEPAPQPPTQQLGARHD